MCDIWEPLAIASASHRMVGVTQFRIGEAAELLGVSADTVRRWADSGKLAAERDANGHRIVAGADLAAFLTRHGRAGDGPTTSSARNRFVGLVTGIKKDTVMAQVEIQAGPHRIVSLMSREALDDLGLDIGSVAAAVVKSTTVIVETPPAPCALRRLARCGNHEASRRSR
jgi:molybdopterin-binding protein